MKKNTLNTLFILLATFFLQQANAQDGYTYTLVDNGSYSYTISAMPNASSSNFPTSVQSYGFTIILPDGVTASITSSLGNGASDTFFDGTAVGEPTIDGYLITETLGAPISLPAPANGIASPVVTIQVAGTPATGSIEILANDSALANAVNPLKSFMSADIIDDGMAVFLPVVDAVGSGLSGTTSYSFNTLSTQDFSAEAINISIYPNPTSSVFSVNSSLDINKVALYDLTGKLILETKVSKNIDISQIPVGLYMINIKSIKGSTTKKLIIK